MKSSQKTLFGPAQKIMTKNIENLNHFYRKNQPNYQKNLTIFIENLDHLSEKFDHFYLQ